MKTSERVFLAMPNDGSCDVILNAYVKPTVLQNCADLVRLGRIIDEHDAISRIMEKIDYCDTLIALVFGRNPHVYFEIGYAVAKRKRCIVVTTDSTIDNFFAAATAVILVESHSDDFSGRLKVALQGGQP